MKLVILDPIANDRNHLILSLKRYFHTRQIASSFEEYSSEIEMFNSVDFQCEQLPCCIIHLSETEQNGLEIAQSIRKLNQDSIVLFTSNCPHHAIEAYRMQADGYLLKPIIPDELEATLNKCLKNIHHVYKKLRVRSDYMTMDIPLRDILYIEVFNKTCVIHTTKKSITSSTTLSELEKKLEKEGFLRCHKSYLINMHHIEESDKTGFLLSNKQFIPIAKRESLKHRETYQNWIWKFTT